MIPSHLPAALDPFFVSCQDPEGGTNSGRQGETLEAIWAITRSEVPRFACCPDLLGLVLEGGGEGIRSLPLPPVPDEAPVAAGLR